MKKKWLAVLLCLLAALSVCAFASADGVSMEELFGTLHRVCADTLENGMATASATDAAEDYFILDTNMAVHLPAGMYRYMSVEDQQVWHGSDLNGNVHAIAFARMDSCHELDDWRSALISAGYSTSARTINGIDFVYAAKKSADYASNNRLFDAVFLCNYQGDSYSIASSGTVRSEVLSLGTIIKTIRIQEQDINLNAASLTLYPTQTFTLVPSCEAGCSGYRFYSTKTTVATVNSLTGIVTAKKAGTASILVVGNNGASVTIPVTVKKSPTIKDIGSLSKTLKVGYTLQLRPRVVLCSSATVTQVPFTFKSSAPTVASVSADGLVIGLKKGTAYITITAGTGSTKRVKVTVKK